MENSQNPSSEPQNTSPLTTISIIASLIFSIAGIAFFLTGGNFFVKNPTQTPIKNNQAQQSQESTSEYRCPNNQRNMVFKNTMNFPVKLYWVRGTGENVYYADLLANAVLNSCTSLGQLWVVGRADSNTTEQNIVINEETRYYEIKLP